MSEEDDEKDMEIGERYKGCPPVDWGAPTAVANFAVPGPHFGVQTYEHEGKFHITLFLPPDTVSEDGRPVHVLGLNELGSSRDGLYWTIGRILVHLGRGERQMPKSEHPPWLGEWMLPGDAIEPVRSTDANEVIAAWCGAYTDVAHQKDVLEAKLSKVEAELQRMYEKLRSEPGAQ